MIFCLANAVPALDPNRSISQYKRESRGNEQGFTGGTIYAIAQTSDGYLWIGCDKGLFRFDGFNFQFVPQTSAPFSENKPVLGLLADDRGNLWTRLSGSALLRYRDGKFTTVLDEAQRPVINVMAMNRASGGRILVATLQGELFQSGAEDYLVPVGGVKIPKSLVNTMAETANGDIWLGTRDNGLFRISGEQITAVTNGLPDLKINCLLADGASGLLIGTDKGLAHWDGSVITTAGLSAAAALVKTQILTMLRDRDQNIWLGTDKFGLVRLNGNGTVSSEDPRQPFDERPAIISLFEDREGNLWAGGAQSLDHYRDGTFATFSTAEGLPSDKNGCLFVDSENRTWFAPLEGGLYWFKDSRVEPVKIDDPADDIVYSISGDGKDNLWLGRRRGGLTHLRFDAGKLISKTYTPADGLAQSNVYAVYPARDGSVWAGTLSGGVSRLKDGEFTNFTTVNGLASNTITAIAESADAAVIWFATPNGLSSFTNGTWKTLTIKDGLPSEEVTALAPDSIGGLWIGTTKGLARLDSGGQVKIASGDSALLREPVFGLAEDKSGSLWLATANHVLRVSRDSLQNDAVVERDVRAYGILDGLKSTEGVKRSRSVTADTLGRVWFSLGRGFSMVDAARLKNDSIPALVEVQSVAVDGKDFDPAGTVSVSAHLQRLVFSYVGLSFSMPERVRFRYRLEGFDQDWSEATNSREAVYTNLSPGTYIFRVIASNSEGFWNSPEAVVRIEIEPMFWQTPWFRALGVLIFAFLLFGLYRLRLRRVSRRLSARFETQLAERTRIAQQLHDSMLQGIVGVSMQLNVAVNNVPADSPSRKQFNRIIESMGRVTAEGRNTLRGLRSASDDQAGSLEQSFAEILSDAAHSDSADFRVVVEGEPRRLHRIAREEIYYIGREAMLNASRHSRAKNIETVVEYAAKFLRVVIRDDGCGIEPRILSSGRENHWGLPGMRERAEKIGAKLRIWSRPGAGTEVELIVPNYVAFEDKNAARRHRRFFGLKLQNFWSKTNE